MPLALKRALSERSWQTISDASLTSAAVLLLLYPQKGEHILVLTKRSRSLPHHKGEVSFPGGVVEKSDASHLAAAVRETQEELGVLLDGIEVLGGMGHVKTATNFVISSFIAYTASVLKFTPNPSEIEQVLEVPISELIDARNWREEVRWKDGRPLRAYSYAWKGHIIYGATATILSDFLGLWREAVGEVNSVVS